MADFDYSRQSLAAPTPLSTNAIAIATVCAVGFYFANPLASLVLLFAFTAGTVYWARGQDRLPRSAIALSAALLIWMAASVLWSPATRPAASAVALYGAVITATLWALIRVEHVPHVIRRDMALGFVLAIALAAWLSLEEMLSDHLLRRALNSYLPLSRPHSIVARTESGWILSMHGYIVNKNVAALVFMMWPALLISRFLLNAPRERWLRWTTVAIAVIAVMLSSHESSKLAILVSSLVFVVACWNRRVAFAIVAFGWIAVTLLIVPAALASYRLGVYKVEQIQFSGRHRLVLWGQTSERVLLKPLLGYGLASTRLVDEMSEPAFKSTIPDTDIPNGLNVHSHNIFLQAWHEIGGVGAILLMLIGVPVLGWLKTRSPQTAPYLLATFTTAVCLASLSWSFVAVWFIASFGYVAVWSHLADTVARDVQEATPRILPIRQGFSGENSSA